MIVARPGVAYSKPLLAAHTRVSIVRLEPKYEAFLAEVNCETGVTHQVRVHLASIGFPLLGDVLYDPHPEKRKLHPPFHQLRAIQLKAPELEVQLDVGFFEKLPWEAAGQIH